MSTTATRQRPIVALIAVLAMFGAMIAIAPVARAAVACGDTVTTDVVLDADLVCSGTHGIIVGASGIAIDLNGFTIRGNGTTGFSGVLSDGFSDVKVVNGTVRGFHYNVQLRNGSGLHAIDLVIRGGETGILLENTDASSADNIDVRNPAEAGVTVAHSTGATLSNVTARGSGWGIFLLDAWGTTVTGADLRRNIIGAALYEGNGNTLGSSIVRNNDVGLLNEDATKTTFTGNDVRRNEKGIVFAVGGEGGQVLDSIVNRNGVGIRLGDLGFDANNVVVSGNVIRNNDGAGIYVEQVSSYSMPHEIEGNRVNNNGHSAGSNPDDGIHVDAPAGAVELENNRANSNADYGIYAPGQTDLGGNSAAGNGNLAQCAGVSC